ncbi:MAG TPA: LEA type 2 family protein [Rectinemataceae bacterium]|nr:LEA type 2 family protein [Rectinemataceae bacterium]
MNSIRRSALALMLIFACFFAADLAAQGFKLPGVTLPAAAPLPTAEITGFQLKAISLRDVTFRFELTVKNPYPVQLSFSGMDMNFSVEGQRVFSAKSQGGFAVPAGNTKTNSFDVTLTYDSIIALVKNYVDKDWLDTTIDGQLTIPLPRIAAFPTLPPDVSFSYKLDKKIPAIKPKVEILNFTVKAPSAAEVSKGLASAASKAKPEAVANFFGALAAGKKPEVAPIKPTDIDVPFTVGFTLAIQNEAKAPLGFDSMDYSLTIGGNDLLQGGSSQVRSVGNLTMVTIESTFSSRKLAQAVIDVFSARKGSFRVVGKASLVLPKEVSASPLPLSFDESGNFSM